MFEVSFKKQYTGAESQLVKKTVSKSFEDVVNVLEKFYGNCLEVFLLIDKHFKHISTLKNDLKN